ncbi:hypothetical protein [Herbaspirillum sp. alder98]|uniref:hypothetical protein n=1 Tax=Herbaspirillum sp. alder98 TaxID=2913096 RepID=UPI001CD9022C|nr:hypothetical protein [Herbaspirillum sp. alder98]MCA1324578.1 hypothetical protein [Herbaspirillum sp. alder98]
MIDTVRSPARNDALISLLRDMQQDPFGNRQLMQWQGMAVDAVLATIDRLAQQLVALAPPTQQSADADVFQVRADTRRRQCHVEQCRELAAQMVFASMQHLDDPQWDPLASTANTEPPVANPSLLVALLELARHPE